MHMKIGAVMIPMNRIFIVVISLNDTFGQIITYRFQLLWLFVQLVRKSNNDFSRLIVGLSLNGMILLIFVIEAPIVCHIRFMQYDFFLLLTVGYICRTSTSVRDFCHLTICVRHRIILLLWGSGSPRRKGTLTALALRVYLRSQTPRAYIWIIWRPI